MLDHLKSTQFICNSHAGSNTFAELLLAAAAAAAAAVAAANQMATGWAGLTGFRHAYS
jgi:hypothetical protein